MTEIRNYAYGTAIESVMPWGMYRAARVLCSDGRIRRTVRIADTAESAFSARAAVRVDGRTVSGYVTVETLEGLSTVTDGDPEVVKFCAHAYTANVDALPSGLWRGTRIDLEHDAPVTRRQGIAYLTTDPDTGEDTGHLATPCTPYGSDSAECAPTAWRVAYLSSVHGDGRPVTRAALDSAMGMVVNGSDDDDVATMIREYGHRQYT